MSSLLTQEERLLLIDTCGETAGVALSCGQDVFAAEDLARGSASAEIVQAIRRLLEQQGLRLRDLDAVGAVSGPGSFTGTRAGLATAKGLCEAAALSLAAVSRLEVLADAAELRDGFSALDAGRNEDYDREDVPVVGVVSRLVWQKGFDLCERVLPVLLRRRRFQLIALGTGEPRYEELFRRLGREFPRQVAYRGGFSEPLAHQIEAGSDMFLMPSRYEPCGLNQMYSLRYGTVPIVHKTGGLADTVHPWNPRTGRGTGFVFEHFDETGLAWAIERSLDVWGDGRGETRGRWRARVPSAHRADQAAPRPGSVKACR